MTPGKPLADESPATPTAPGPQRVAASAEIAEDDRLLVRVGEVEVGIFRLGGQLHAWENRCPHQGGPVCTGRVLGRTELVLAADKTAIREQRSSEDIHIACPWHGWEFDVRTGVCQALPSRSLHRIEVSERDGEVYLEP
jgi:nitrite reductase/ring-hydroxylating ferredoxin subunit